MLTKHLPRILPTQHIKLKWDQLLLFTIVDVTEFKEAIATAINLDPDLHLNFESDYNPKSDAAILSINPGPVSVNRPTMLNSSKKKKSHNYLSTALVSIMNHTCPRFQTVLWLHLQSFWNQALLSERIHWSNARERFHPPIQVPLWLPDLFCQEGWWKPSSHCWLPKA